MRYFKNDLRESGLVVQRLIPLLLVATMSSVCADPTQPQPTDDSREENSPPTTISDNPTVDETVSVSASPAAQTSEDTEGKAETPENSEATGKAETPANAETSANAAEASGNDEAPGNAETHENTVSTGNAETHENSLSTGNALTSGSARSTGSSRSTGSARSTGNTFSTGSASTSGARSTGSASTTGNTRSTGSSETTGDARITSEFGRSTGNAETTGNARITSEFSRSTGNAETSANVRITSDFARSTSDLDRSSVDRAWVSERPSTRIAEKVRNSYKVKSLAARDGCTKVGEDISLLEGDGAMNIHGEWCSPRLNTWSFVTVVKVFIGEEVLFDETLTLDHLHPIELKSGRNADELKIFHFELQVADGCIVFGGFVAKPGEGVSQRKFQHFQRDPLICLPESDRKFNYNSEFNADKFERKDYPERRSEYAERRPDYAERRSEYPERRLDNTERRVDYSSERRADFLKNREAVDLNTLQSEIKPRRSRRPPKSARIQVPFRIIP